MNGFFRKLISILAAVAIVIAVFLTAMDILLYHVPGYYAKEYARYGVHETTKTSPEELEKVTRQMMAYLRGDRELLSDITAVVDGVPDTLFFNEKECSHMADCRGLFRSGYGLRSLCLGIALLLFSVLLLLNRNRFPEALADLAGGMLWGTLLSFVLGGGLAFLLCSDFDRYFTLFHIIFFDNQNWTFDPRESRMINMLPEGFFFDTAIYTVLIFVVLMAVILIGAVLYLHSRKKADRAQK